MSDLTPEDLEFVRDYAERNADYAIVGPVVDFINRHLAPPRIIRTVAELEAEDPDTVVLGCDYSTFSAGDMGMGELLPSVVVATGEQVRAAQEALEKETNND